MIEFVLDPNLVRDAVLQGKRIFVSVGIARDGQRIINASLEQTSSYKDLIK
jgi:hypothetical protein